MIVWLASFPRSGNTFFRILLHEAHGLTTYSIHGDLLFERIGVAETIGHAPMPASIDELDRRAELYLIKTHDLPRDGRPAIYLVRDGRDALVSYTHFRAQCGGARWRRWIAGLLSTGFQRRLTRTICDQRYGGWSGHVDAWLNGRRAGAPTTVVRFEDLVRNPHHALASTRSQLGLESAPMVDGFTSFADLQRRWPQFFRKGREAAWIDEMSPANQKLFWRLHGRSMRMLGYTDQLPSGKLVETNQVRQHPCG